MDPQALSQTPADIALDRALAESDYLATVGKSAISGAAVSIADFTAGTAATTIAALSFTLPASSSVWGAQIVGSFTCTLAAAATMSVLVPQNVGGVASGGTVVGGFRYTGSAITITGGTVTTGLGATSVYQVATGNIAKFTFPINGLVFAPAGSTIVLPITVAISTSTVAVTNATLIISAAIF